MRERCGSPPPDAGDSSGAPGIDGGPLIPLGTPTNLTAKVGGLFILARWDAPSKSGAGPIASYTVTVTDPAGLSHSYATTETSILVAGGLSSDITYQIVVAAQNGAGLGPPSDPILATPRLTCDRTFAPYRTLPVGSFPVAVVVGDFASAGHTDIAVANEGFSTGSVSVLMNDGAGSFSASTEYAVAPFPRTLAVADVDQNGQPDLVVGGSRETILFNAGKGRFDSREDFGSGALSMAVGDLDGDRFPDIAVVDQMPDAAVRYLNLRDRTFGPFALRGQGTRPYAIAMGDLNGDAHPDLVIGFQSQVGILLGNGDDTFAEQITQEIGGVPAIALALADFDGDGRLDIAVGNEDSVRKQLTLLVNRRDGTSFMPVTVSTGIAPVHLAIADVNLDGKPDILYTDESDSMGVLINLGGGAFAPPTVFATMRSPVSIASGDINGDGYPDAIIAHSSDNVISILLNVCTE